ncbi:MAG: hypothetical protein A2038_11420, partial [Deltaproteobacteria bacterium GWA2_57_13]
LNATSEKAFCAGGDVKSLVNELKKEDNSAYGREYFAAEYFVDYFIHVYPKPILCWADGITMGGGIGIMNGASHRVVTERTVLAMPEIAIGFFADVGATYFFSRLPQRLGLFLGLTGARFDGFDAVAIRMADAWVRSEKKKSVFAELLRLDWAGDSRRDREILSRYLASLADANASPNSSLLKRLQEIETFMDKVSMDEIDEVLRKWEGKDAWMRSALQGYFAGSPTSAKAIFEEFKRGKNLPLKEAFLREWDMAVHFCDRSDFREGIRALLVDKDRRPLWNPPTLAQVRDEEIERFFLPPSAEPHLLRHKIDETGIG